MMEEYFPIKNITTYTSNWTIKARVIDKAPLRQLRDTMHIMHVDIVDKHVSAALQCFNLYSQGDTIRAKFWGKAAIKWDEVLQKGKVRSKHSVRVHYDRRSTHSQKVQLTYPTRNSTQYRTIMKFGFTRKAQSSLRRTRVTL